MLGSRGHPQGRRLRARDPGAPGPGDRSAHRRGAQPRARPAAPRGARSATSPRRESVFTRRRAGCGSSSSIQDLRYGYRDPPPQPAFAATTVLTLAIGLALTTGVFTVFNAYVLRRSRCASRPGCIRSMWHARDAAGRNLRWRDYQAIRDRRDLFTDAIAQSTRYVSSKGRPLAAELVSATTSRRSGAGGPARPAARAGRRTRQRRGDRRPGMGRPLRARRPTRSDARSI